MRVPSPNYRAINWSHRKLKCLDRIESVGVSWTRGGKEAQKSGEKRPEGELAPEWKFNVSPRWSLYRKSREKKDLDFEDWSPCLVLRSWYNSSVVILSRFEFSKILPFESSFIPDHNLNILSACFKWSPKEGPSACAWQLHHNFKNRLNGSGTRTEEPRSTWF